MQTVFPQRLDLLPDGGIVALETSKSKEDIGREVRIARIGFEQRGLCG